MCGLARSVPLCVQNQLLAPVNLQRTLVTLNKGLKARCSGSASFAGVFLCHCLPIVVLFLSEKQSEEKCAELHREFMACAGTMVVDNTAFHG